MLVTHLRCIFLGKMTQHGYKEAKINSVIKYKPKLAQYDTEVLTFKSSIKKTIKVRKY